MSNKISAKEVEAFLLPHLKNSVRGIKGQLGTAPRLVIINASDNKANQTYVKGKIKMGDELGIDVTNITYPESNAVTTESIIQDIEWYNRNNIPVIVQLPMYEHLDKERILKAIKPYVDADGFTNEWMGQTYMSNTSRVQPATPKGVMQLLDFYMIDCSSKVALVIGTGKHTGQSLANMLMNAGATVITANSRTKNLKKLTKMADIIISCVGKPNLIHPWDVKEGAILVGVGFSYIEGKQVQDFNEEYFGHCKYVTTRTNCTGKMTILALMHNVVELYKMNLKLYNEED